MRTLPATGFSFVAAMEGMMCSCVHWNRLVCVSK